VHSPANTPRKSVAPLRFAALGVARGMSLTCAPLTCLPVVPSLTDTRTCPAAASNRDSISSGLISSNPLA